MTGKRTRIDHAKLAANHLATLNAFAGVLALLDSDLILEESTSKAVSRMIAICKQEQRKQLDKYDAAMARVALSE